MLYRVIYKIRKLIWRLFRTTTVGVKVLLIIANDQVVLVKPRHLSYFLIPGGNLDSKDEDLENAAKREVFEELGVVLTEVRLFGHYISTAEGKLDYITLFVADLPNLDNVSLQTKELSEYKALRIAEALSDPFVSTATKRRLREYLDDAVRSDRW